jgi:DNA-binding transcriptional ArsR family regulator
MGASKTQQYSDLEISTAIIARALAHPARLRILNLLNEHHQLRNIDLVEHLSLVQSTINAHLTKLKDAQLIELEFNSNCYRIKTNDLAIENAKCAFELYVK